MRWRVDPAGAIRNSIVRYGTPQPHRPLGARMRPKIGHDRSTMRSRTDRPPWRLSRIRIIRPRTPQEDRKSLPSQFGQNCDIKKAGNSLGRAAWFLILDLVSGGRIVAHRPLTGTPPQSRSARRDVLANRSRSNTRKTDTPSLTGSCCSFLAPTPEVMRIADLAR